MCLLAQPGQPARQRLKSQQYNRNIEKRGQVPKSKQPKKEGYTVGPVLLALTNGLVKIYRDSVVFPLRCR